MLWPHQTTFSCFSHPCSGKCSWFLPCIVIYIQNASKRCAQNLCTINIGWEKHVHKNTHLTTKNAFSPWISSNEVFPRWAKAILYMKNTWKVKKTHVLKTHLKPYCLAIPKIRGTAVYVRGGQPGAKLVLAANEPLWAKKKLWFHHCDFEMSGLATTLTYLSISGQARPRDLSAEFGVCLQFWPVFLPSKAGIAVLSLNIELLLLYSARRVQFIRGLDASMLKLLATRTPTSKVLSVFEPWRNTCLEATCRLLLFFGKGGFPLGFPYSPDIEQCSCYEDVYDKATFLCQLPLSSWPWMVETYGLSALEQRLARIFIFKRICLSSFLRLSEGRKSILLAEKFCLNKILKPNWKQLKLALCFRTEGSWKAVVFEHLGLSNFEGREYPFLESSCGSRFVEERFFLGTR
jgi:hypothetical protein